MSTATTTTTTATGRGGEGALAEGILQITSRASPAFSHNDLSESGLEEGTTLSVGGWVALISPRRGRIISVDRMA